MSREFAAAKPRPLLAVLCGVVLLATFERADAQGRTERVSVASDGSEADDSSGGSLISADGRFVAFVSWATNMAPGHWMTTPAIYLHDRWTGTTTWVTAGPNGAKPHAEECRYVYKGAAGDPYYYPTRAKTSVWDLFELASGAEACKAFAYVAVRAPHGKPLHLHLRYGDEHSSFRQLLQMSTGPEDKTTLDPWGSVYCAEGVSGCDK